MLRVFYLYALALGLVAGCISCGGGQPPTTPPTPLPAIWAGPTRFFTQDHDHPKLHDGQCVINGALLGQIATAGFWGVRLDNVFVPGETPHNADGSYNYACIAAMWQDVTKYGLTPIFTIANPQDDADAAALPPYLAGAVKYAPELCTALLELGNEPDAPQYWGWRVLTPATYWAQVYPAADAWFQGCPAESFIGTGGTQKINTGWQTALVAAIRKTPKAGGGTVDEFANGEITALSVHLYGESLRPNPVAHATGQQGLSRLVTDLTALAKIAPSGVTVWATEYGVDAWSSADLIGDPPGVAPQLQTQPGWLDSIQALGVPLFSVYQSIDNCPNEYQIGDQCWSSATPSPSATPLAPTTDGLINIDGTPKAAYGVVKRYFVGPSPSPSP